MIRKFFGIPLFVLLVLTACISLPVQPQTAPTEVLPSPSAEGVESQPVVYPGIEQTAVEIYPGPVVLPEGTELDDPAYLAPQPGDENLTRSTATVEIGDSELVVMESYPVQVAAILRGYMPNPCHQLRAVVGSPDEQNKIQIEVYSVVDPNMICTEVINPFEIRLPLGSYQGSTFQFIVNGELLGEVET